MHIWCNAHKSTKIALDFKATVSIRSYTFPFPPPQKGFGNIDGEHWLGLDNIYHLAKQGDYKLLVELEDWVGKKVYAEYSSFHLESESEGFRMRLGTYQGNAGDSLTSNNGKPFTTLDRDKDAFTGQKYSKQPARSERPSMSLKLRL